MFRASSDQEAEMAPQGKKKGRSKTSWEEATKEAVKQLTESGNYTVTMQVDVKVESPGVVHEYVVEVG